MFSGNGSETREIEGKPSATILRIRYISRKAGWPSKLFPRPPRSTNPYMEKATKSEVIRSKNERLLRYQRQRRKWWKRRRKLNEVKLK